MPDTGWLLVGTGASGGTGEAWTNPSNITGATDFSEAVYAPGGGPESAELRGTNIGAAIPSGNTPVGVEVRVEVRAVSSTSPVISEVRLYNSGGIGTAKTPSTSLTSTRTTYDFGGAADDWDATLTDVIVESSTFGAYVKCAASSGNSIRVDTMWIKIHYAETPETGERDHTDDAGATDAGSYVTDAKVPITRALYTPPEYVIWLSAPDTLDRVQRLVWFEHLSFNLRDYALGAFSFSVHNRHISQDWLLNDGLVEILRDGEQVYVGMVDSVQLDDASGYWRVSGLDARLWFSFRDARPPSGSEFDAVSAVTAGNAIIHYVENNFSQPVDTDRDADSELGTNVAGQAVSWTVPASSALGATVSENARYGNLLPLLFKLARQGGIFFRVKLAATSGLSLYNRYELEIYAGTDRTEGEVGGMVFSVKLGTAASVNYQLSRRGHQNAILALGQGEGSARTVEEQTDAADVAAHFRREGTLDARNSDTTALLQAAADARIAASLDGIEQWTVAPDPVRAPWRTSWDLGDIVTVRSRHVDSSADKAITAVAVRYDRNSGEQVTITLGDPPATIGVKLAGKLDELNRVVVE